MKSILGVGFAVLGLAVPGFTQGATAPALDKLLSEFVAAYNAKDPAKLASLYAEDGVLMPPGTPMIHGRSNIEAVFKKQFEQSRTLKLSPTDSAIAGALAFAAGTFTVTISRGVAVPTSIVRGTPAGVGTESQVFAAKYLTVFKRVGNDWKIAYDMQNADQPER